MVTSTSSPRIASARRPRGPWRTALPLTMSVAVGLSLFGVCMWSNVIGAIVPLAASRVGIDPAVVSAPFISTLVDATGMVIYFTIAIMLLGLTH